MKHAAAAVLLALAALCAAPPARAVQLNVLLQGYLANSSGTPYTTPQTTEFKVYQGGNATTAGSGTLVYDETGTVTPAPSGVFTYLLGSGSPSAAPLSAAAFDTAQPIYIEISVGGTILLPRLQLTGMPYAAIAAVAESLKPVSLLTTSALIASSGSFTASGAQYSVTTSSGIQVLAGGVTAPFFAGAFHGDGSGLIGVTATQVRAADVVAGPLASAVLPSTVAYTSVPNTFTQPQSFGAGLTAATGAFTATGSVYSLTTSSGISVAAGGLTAPYVSAGTIAGTLYGDASHVTGIPGAVPVGAIMPYAGTAEPAGWIECDGRSLPQSGSASAGWGSYSTSALFAAIGTVWGSAGAGQFNIPDLRGIFPRGYNHGKTGSFSDPDAASRVAQYASGATGDAVGTYELDQVGEHHHTISNPSYPVTQNTDIIRPPSPASQTNGVARDSGAETRAKNASVLYLIRVK